MLHRIKKAFPDGRESGSQENERAAELDKFLTHDSEDLSITRYRK
jgi:hypothetical protein